jgi:NADH-quinone oxidoreductase subunit E
VSVRRLHNEQPASFAFTPENREWAEGQLKKYPRGREASAVIPLLWRAQEQHGWLPEPAIRHVAEMLGMKPIRVLEVATFYTMYNLKPVGKHFVQVCGNISCLLRGADELMKTCEKEIGPRDTVNEDLDMSWTEVECAGACTNAPVVAIGDDYIEDLTGEKLADIIAKLRNGEAVKPGPQNGRFSSEPMGGATSLLDKQAIFEAWKAYSPKTDAGQGGEDAEPALLADAHEEPELITDTHEEPELIEDEHEEPELLSAPREGKGDDLKRIKGVGPKLEGILHDLGFYHFDQIANWSRENIAWVDGRLKFKGRIERDDWVSQARLLASGEETEFSKRVDKGEVPSSKKGGA